MTSRPLSIMRREEEDGEPLGYSRSGSGRSRVCLAEAKGRRMGAAAGTVLRLQNQPMAGKQLGSETRTRGKGRSKARSERKRTLLVRRQQRSGCKARCSFGLRWMGNPGFGLPGSKQEARASARRSRVVQACESDGWPCSDPLLVAGQDRNGSGRTKVANGACRGEVRETAALSDV